ncbi:hypothetical protein DICPUDRAFT_73949 [Dictyostelium purpureum]|uniref:Uncharacterized protein n=1 Tax=Dictyostelium purpureum TaxID=5786 RepID=F0Z6B8_DICPU|nr:uncharacterized protein DICPUDRAFT_73949 [Dictyostelium purpureum]EGC40413.1 hypothetical protein DICPUDRAFT_73949 [Dictyostelium purpureum]|eukprot:XP_003282960.1 hypothetical protein DICPUDRAFT_73949 [Dictyostelium purpureum]
MIESSISRFDNITDNSELTNGDGIYYIKCNWQHNSFTIYLTDLTNVWSSNIPSKYIDNILKPQGMASEEYMNLLKKSLLNQDITKKQFDYKINKSKKSSSDIELCIIIILSEFDNINIKSNIPLIKVNNTHQSFQNYFNWLFEKYKSLTDQNQQLVQLNQSLQLQFNQSIEQNKIFIKEKEKIESDLYEKFIIILNEKKKKIKEFKQKIEGLTIENNNLIKQNQHNNNNNNSNKKLPQAPIKNTPKKKIKFNNSSYGSIFDDIMHNGDNDDNDDFKNTIDDIDNTYKPTFNNSTLSIDLLSNDDAYSVPISVRKRFKPPNNSNDMNNTLTTTSTASTTPITNLSSNLKTPTKKRTSISPKKSPFKQPQQQQPQQQQQQQKQQPTLNYRPSPIKKRQSTNSNYITHRVQLSRQIQI